MTNAELRTIRDGLGLSVAWCALHVGGGVSTRAWNYWESGRKDIPVRVPNDVAEKMWSLAQAIPDALNGPEKSVKRRLYPSFFLKRVYQAGSAVRSIKQEDKLIAPTLPRRNCLPFF